VTGKALSLDDGITIPRIPRIKQSDAIRGHRFGLLFSTRKVGGLRFIKLGRLTVSYSISKAYKPL
jgi:hypothetical protein